MSTTGTDAERKIEEISEIIEQFDRNFDDPGVALQDIAKILGIDRVVCEDYEDDDDEDWLESGQEEDVDANAYSDDDDEDDD